MQERAIHISSVKRQKIGENKAEDFIIKFGRLMFWCTCAECGIKKYRFVKSKGN